MASLVTELFTSLLENYQHEQIIAANEQLHLLTGPSGFSGNYAAKSKVLQAMQAWFLILSLTKTTTTTKNKSVIRLILINIDQPKTTPN